MEKDSERWERGREGREGRRKREEGGKEERKEGVGKELIRKFVHLHSGHTLLGNFGQSVPSFALSSTHCLVDSNN